MARVRDAALCEETGRQSQERMWFVDEVYFNVLKETYEDLTIRTSHTNRTPKIP